MPYDWVGINTPSDYATEHDERNALRTFAAEPANEDSLGDSTEESENAWRDSEVERIERFRDF